MGIKVYFVFRSCGVEREGSEAHKYGLMRLKRWELTCQDIMVSIVSRFLGNKQKTPQLFFFKKSFFLRNERVFLSFPCE